MDGYTQYLKGFGAVIDGCSLWLEKGKSSTQSARRRKASFAKYYKDKGSNAMFAMFQRNVRNGFLWLKGSSWCSAICGMAGPSTALPTLTREQLRSG
jgi:hypothetical protein